MVDFVFPAFLTVTMLTGVCYDMLICGQAGGCVPLFMTKFQEQSYYQANPVEVNLLRRGRNELLRRLYT